MAGLLDEQDSPLNQLIALAQAAGQFRGTSMDNAYHNALLRAASGALAGTHSAASAGSGASVLASPQLAQLQRGAISPEVQAWFSQSAAGRSGFGSGLAYRNEDLGKNF